MRKLILSSLSIFICLLIVSCGESKQEKIAREQKLAKDSIARVDSINKVKATQDSIENAKKAETDNNEKMAFLNSFYKKLLDFDDCFQKAKSYKGNCSANILKEMRTFDPDGMREGSNAIDWRVFTDGAQDTVDEGYKFSVSHESGDWYRITIRNGEATVVRLRLDKQNGKMMITGLSNSENGIDIK